MAMKRNSLRLYFVAIVPEAPIYAEILALKTEIRDRYGSKAALRSPPHITMHMPFQWKEEKESQLLNSLNELAILQQQFKLIIEDFGAFPPRVIYVQVKENQLLNMFQKEVGRNALKNWHIYPKSGSRAFAPHMTIAFRDLKKPKFIAAWKEFEQRKYYAEFTVLDLCLLKHNGKSWDIFHRSPLLVP
jgi:2'-5' RNA ligase